MAPRGALSTLLIRRRPWAGSSAGGGLEREVYSGDVGSDEYRTDGWTRVERPRGVAIDGVWQGYLGRWRLERKASGCGLGFGEWNENFRSSRKSVLEGAAWRISFGAWSIATVTVYQWRGRSTLRPYADLSGVRFDDT